jgi:hypothetical protein
VPSSAVRANVRPGTCGATFRSVYRVDPSARPLAATLTSPARRSSRVGASLPRPDPAFKDRDAFGCFTAWLGLPHPGPILEGPGADPPSPWLGSAPEATPGTRTRTCGRSGDAASRGSGEAPRRATSPRTVWPAGRYGWRVRRRPGWFCAGDPHTTWPRASPGATRSGVALGPVPSRPSSSTLAPRPLEGRVCGWCPDPEP